MQTYMLDIRVNIALIWDVGGGEEIGMGISEQIRPENSAKILHAQLALNSLSLLISTY